MALACRERQDLRYLVGMVGENALAQGLDQRLAACINQLPGVTSVYRWQGRMSGLVPILRKEMYDPTE